MTGKELVRELDREGEQQGPPVQASYRHSRASVRFFWGRARFEADVDVTPGTFLAIGGMVGMILLAVAPIVLAGGQARRRR